MLYFHKLSLPFFAAALCLLLATVSCTSGPPSAPMGSPAFYWKAANETYAAGDFTKAARNLEDLVKKESEFTARAQPWRLVVTAGLAKGYAELANNFEFGARANKTNPTPFRTQLANYRRSAGQYALQYAETFLAFEKHDHTQPVPLAFPFPTANPAKVTELDKIANGILLPGAQMPPIEKRVLSRAVVMAAAAAVGAGEDVAMAQQTLGDAGGQIDHDVFALCLAQTFYDLSWIFSRDKLNLPDRVELFCSEGLDAVKSIKQETKESKKIASDLEKMLKSVKK